MPGLLAPLLAQLVTLAIADRLEGHYVLNKDEHFFETTDLVVPGATAVFDWRRATLTLTYAPSLSVIPIWASDDEPRELLFSQRGALDFQYRWRSTTLTLNNSGIYGQRDFAEEAIAAGQLLPTASTGTPQTGAQQVAPGGATPSQQAASAPPTGTGTPATGTGTPTTGAANTAALNGGRVDYLALRAAGALDHRISRNLSWRVGAGYTIAGGLGRDAQVHYPLARGPDASASLRFAVDSRNVFQTLLVAQIIYADHGNAFMTTLGEDYSYNFTRTLVATVGAGVSFARSMPETALIPLYSIYPTGRVMLIDQSRLGSGTLSISAGVTTSPAVDMTTISVDPRVAFFGSASWRRDHFALTLTSSSQLSITPENSNAFSAIFAGIDASYTLPGNFIASTGVRGAWQKLGTDVLLEPSAVFYVALGWSAIAPLNEPTHEPVHEPLNEPRH